MLALVSACFHKKSSKRNSSNFWDESFVRDVLWKGTVVNKLELSELSNIPYVYVCTNPVSSDLMGK